MKVLQWCRANAMPVIAVLAAAVTAVFVPPDSAYLGYYDVKTLSCLFCILAVVCALRGAGLFPLLAQRLVRAFHTARSSVTALVVVTLIGSMLLTNDTALLTFLPLSWFVLEGTGQTKHTALTFILQNCAANLGGMLTPFGNPQNLYLFNHYTIPNGEFLTIMLPPFLLSTALILLCTSMAAWYISRVGSLVSKIVYYLCVFSMVVPFQMVMFTLSRTAEQVKLPYFSLTSMAFAKIGLNTPWTIPIVYLGFGAGLAVFMFSGFVKTIPLEIEEAAAIDGCGPVRTFFLVVLPMLKPTFISVGVLEIMWVWNDFLLPYLVLDLNKYRTIPIVIQYLKGSYGQVDMGATMALILLSIVPVIIFYLCCQKHIIKGVAAGAVKG